MGRIPSEEKPEPMKPNNDWLSIFGVPYVQFAGKVAPTLTPHAHIPLSVRVL